MNVLIISERLKPSVVKSRSVREDNAVYTCSMGASFCGISFDLIVLEGYDLSDELQYSRMIAWLKGFVLCRMNKHCTLVGFPVSVLEALNISGPYGSKTLVPVSILKDVFNHDINISV